MVVGGGALLVFFGMSVLGRTVSLPLSRAIGAPLPWLRGVTGKLARQNATRNPKRTAASASALMIGVGLVGFITILASSSTTASVNSTIDHSFAGDIVIDSGDFLGTPAFDANFAVRYDSQVFIKKAPDASTAAALAAVRGIATKYSGTTVMDQAAFKTARAKPIQQMLMLVYALLALAILIALLGIGNTLALSIFERTRELGVMRAVGMTRQQLRAMIRWESVIIALQGTVLGLLIGVFFRPGARTGHEEPRESPSSASRC